MAITHARFAAAPERVFDVLADPAKYGDWVVGSDIIRDADANWPAVGSRFHHRVGFGPLKVNDHTEVLDVEPPLRLVMHARARPVGTAEVTMLMTPDTDGTYVTMVETAGDRLSRVGINRLTDPLVRLRNIKSLRRLKRIVETDVVKP
ncbi:MAG: SRPBCC family protein [Solirubrobacteraceae bacterium]